MTKKQNLKNILITSLVMLSLGGWLLHIRVHSPSNFNANYIPFISGIFSCFILPFMFYYKPTLAYAYVLNGMTVIIGTITMSHFSIAHLQPGFGLRDLLVNTTLADIFLLFGKFFVGKAIFDLEVIHNDTDAKQTGRFLRYPNMGWWILHLVLMSVVYALGNILWK